MIKQRACNDELLLLESLNYDLHQRWLVIYGLQVQRFDNLREAEEHWLSCFRHDQRCRHPGEGEDDAP